MLTFYSMFVSHDSVLHTALYMSISTVESILYDKIQCFKYFRHRFVPFDKSALFFAAAVEESSSTTSPLPVIAMEQKDFEV